MNFTSNEKKDPTQTVAPTISELGERETEHAQNTPDTERPSIFKKTGVMSEKIELNLIHKKESKLEFTLPSKQDNKEQTTLCERKATILDTKSQDNEPFLVPFWKMPPKQILSES